LLIDGLGALIRLLMSRSNDGASSVRRPTIEFLEEEEKEGEEEGEGEIALLA
jgi:hypothetical protein